MISSKKLDQTGQKPQDTSAGLPHISTAHLRAPPGLLEGSRGPNLAWEPSPPPARLSRVPGAWNTLLGASCPSPLQAPPSHCLELGSPGQGPPWGSWKRGRQRLPGGFKPSWLARSCGFGTVWALVSLYTESLRIRESIRLEKTSGVIESDLWPNTTKSTRPRH